LIFYIKYTYLLYVNCTVCPNRKIPKIPYPGVGLNEVSNKKINKIIKINAFGGKCMTPQ